MLNLFMTRLNNDDFCRQTAMIFFEGGKNYRAYFLSLHVFGDHSDFSHLPVDLPVDLDLDPGKSSVSDPNYFKHVRKF